MLELFVALPPEAVTYVEEYQIDLPRYEEQNIELYSYIYIIQAHRFMELYNEKGLSIYHTMALLNLNRYLELTEDSL